MSNTGSCLCGQIQFSIQKEIKVIYHCHCGLCRKQSGTASNSAVLINQQEFQWRSGVELIQTYKKETGFTASFCHVCGSPVPNQVAETAYMWVPLGLLDKSFIPHKRLNFCMSSRALWENEILGDQNFTALPSWEELQQYFD